MTDHPYGWFSLLPPCVAIVLAIATRRVITSLLIGVFVGALITCGGNPLLAIGRTLEVHLWKSLVDEDRLRVFAFTLLMGAMVGVISASGGMRGLVEAITPWAKNRRRGQLTTWALGLVIFFDDYANTLLLGSTMRPLCDRLKISRQKLAYLVDSTAAPVAGLVPISTWVAVEIDYVNQGVQQLSSAADLKAFELFINSIPYRFYVLWALLFVPLIAWLGRDFGPMLRAERDCLNDHEPNKKSVELAASDSDSSPKNIPGRWYNAVIPIFVTVGSILWLLYNTGLQPATSDSPDSPPSLMNIFGAADSYYSLLWGSLAGLTTAILLVCVQRLLNRKEILSAASSGTKLMLPALAILWLAASLSTMTGNSPVSNESVAIAGEGGSEYESAPYRLYTGEFLSSLIGDNTNAALLPTLVFVLSGAVAFATGTSWGTMGIVLPLVIPLAYAVLSANGPVSPESPILLGTIGGVLSGAIFGDHCSPISDTTILSSQASGCDHVAHVWTQMPYALTVAAVSIVFGTLPIGFGVSCWLLLPLGVVAMAILLLLFGRRAEL